MRIELRNGEVVDVLTPSEQHAKAMADRADAERRRGRWFFHFERGVPVSARWYQRIDAELVGGCFRERNTMSDEWQVPRCSHGNIILGCPEKVCPEQDDEIATNQAMLDAYYARQAQEAREFIEAIVRPAAVVSLLEKDGE